MPDIRFMMYVIKDLECDTAQDPYIGGNDSGSRGCIIPPEPTISRRSLVRGPVYLLKQRKPH